MLRLRGGACLHEKLWIWLEKMHESIPEGEERERMLRYAKFLLRFNYFISVSLDTS